MTRPTCQDCHKRPVERPDTTRCRTCRRHKRRNVAGARILVLDIETSPNLAYVWGLWDQNVSLNQLEASTEVICFAAKWLGAADVMFFAGPELIPAAHAMLDEADAVVHYNGKRFDTPHLNREFLQAGLPPPSPFQEIDLLATVKRRFRFPSNKLQYVSTALGLPGKAEHEGFDLWRKCMAGDVDAWARMERYNRQDVVLTEEVYQILLPWIPGHPNSQLYVDGSGCPVCGGDVEPAGFYRTRLSKFRQYRCGSCGAYCRESRRLGGVNLQEAVR